MVVKDIVNFTWDRVRKGTDYLPAMQGLMVMKSSIVALSHLKEVGRQYHVVIVEFGKF